MYAKTYLKVSAFCLCFTLMTGGLHAQTLAFPGAEGYGRFAKGGRGGKVIEVTTLNPTGPGSFLEAVNDPDPRTIVFKVGGVIDYSSYPVPLYVQGDYMTIAGQTAPGDGILIKGLTLYISGNDTVIRYLELRPGEVLGSNVNLASANSLGILAESNVIVDHVSMSWAPDDITFTYADNTTYQRSIISEGLHCVSNDGSCHSKGLGVGYNQPLHASLSHNLFANTSDRNPTIGSGTVDVINNVMSNVGGAPLFNPYWAPAHMNYVGNYYTPDKDYLWQLTWFLGQGVAQYTTQSSVYPEGNISPTFRPNNSLPETDIMNFSNPPFVPILTTRIPGPTYASETDAFEAYDDVLADVGANGQLNADGSLTFRLGTVDARVINEVKTGTGKLVYSSVREVGGYPVVKNGTPYADADHDGMSDLWEDMHGLDKFDPDDRNGDFNGDGYTNLEDFLYGILPVTIPGDFNGDGKVDGADLAQWQGDYGVNGDSDADHDGDSDGADFLAWQRGFGYGTLSASTTVPEPSTSLLILIGIAICFPQRSKHV